MSSSVDALADISEVVMKFTAQYHPEAHHRLANEGLAPVLHACVPVCGGLFMVVVGCVGFGRQATEGSSFCTTSTRTSKMPSPCFIPRTSSSVISVHRTSWSSLADQARTPDVAVCSSTLTGLGLMVSGDPLLLWIKAC